MRLTANCKQRLTQSCTLRFPIGKGVSAGGRADQQEKAGKTSELVVETRWQPPVKEAKSSCRLNPEGDSGRDQAGEAKIT